MHKTPLALQKKHKTPFAYANGCKQAAPQCWVLTHLKAGIYLFIFLNKETKAGISNSMPPQKKKKDDLMGWKPMVHHFFRC